MISTAEAVPHGAVLTIDLSAIAANWRALSDRAAPAACGAAVKADAYGLGAARVAPALYAAGARRFYVATPAEGAALRCALPEVAEIVILNGPRLAEPATYLAHRLIPTLNDPGDLTLWREAAAAAGRPLPAALQLDTGMSRLGVEMKDIAQLTDHNVFTGLEIIQIMSHLACADEPGHPMNAAQRRRFAAALARLRPLLPRADASLCNSAGIFLGPDYHFDAVRPGAALYGLSPDPARANPMTPVVTLEAPILQIRTVRPPAVVGYGATRAAVRPMRLATIGLGYADGFIRALGARGGVVVGGVPAPLFGRISMDVATVDISHLPESTVHAGMRVQVLGPDLPVDTVAAQAGTIGYEVLTGLGARFERRYVGGGGGVQSR